jgi:hypothetical protein
MATPRTKFDHETGEYIPAHHMTKAEFRDWDAANRRRWKSMRMVRENPPGPPDAWVWNDLHGWIRRWTPKPADSPATATGTSVLANGANGASRASEAPRTAPAISATLPLESRPGERPASLPAFKKVVVGKGKTAGKPRATGNGSRKGRGKSKGSKSQGPSLF